MIKEKKHAAIQIVCLVEVHYMNECQGKTIILMDKIFSQYKPDIRAVWSFIDNSTWEGHNTTKNISIRNYDLWTEKKYIRKVRHKEQAIGYHFMITHDWLSWLSYHHLRNGKMTSGIDITISYSTLLLYWFFYFCAFVYNLKSFIDRRQ